MLVVPAVALLPLAGTTPGSAFAVLTASELLIAAVLAVNMVAAGGVRAMVNPDDLQGRVSSASRFVTLGVLPVGALLGGLIGGQVGNRPALWCAVALMACSIAVSLASPLRTHRRVPPEWIAA